jgi:acetyl esterase/lipase
MSANISAKASDAVNYTALNSGGLSIAYGTKATEVINNPAFVGFGRFLFPTERGLPGDDITVSGIESLLPYHSDINEETTVEVLNYLLDERVAKEIVFYDIYTENEKQADPTKNNTGLFFFRGEPNAPFAIACAGGGFSYVGSIHESFPLALELSKKGYNAFAIQYRTGGAEIACADLAAAVSFIFKNAGTLKVNTEDYSLWGGSAGARMAAYLGSYGAAAYGGDDVPKPAAIIMQYTGHSDYTENDPPTYACIGENDGIASPQAMQRRVNAQKEAGIDVEFHLYPNLGHGFGLGIGTSAEGWHNDALSFWEGHMEGATAKPGTARLERNTFLWSDGNMPAKTAYTENNGNYSDPPGFRPSMEWYPAKKGAAVKGAIMICAGGAFMVRSAYDEAPVAKCFNELGYHAFVVKYRLRPYTQEEGALDLARAVRFVRSHADELGMDKENVAAIGFSAGGILCGEMLLNFGEQVDGTALDLDYMPDAIDKISADIAADGMIYSFYGRLSVASTDVEKFKESDLPPTRFVYGSEEIFRNQIEACANAARQAGVMVDSHVLDGRQHGFGADDGEWIREFDKWLTPIFENN